MFPLLAPSQESLNVAYASFNTVVSRSKMSFKPRGKSVSVGFLDFSDINIANTIFKTF